MTYGTNTLAGWLRNAVCGCLLVVSCLVSGWTYTFPTDTNTIWIDQNHDWQLMDKYHGLLDSPAWSHGVQPAAVYYVHFGYDGVGNLLWDAGANAVYAPYSGNSLITSPYHTNVSRVGKNMTPSGFGVPNNSSIVPNVVVGVDYPSNSMLTEVKFAFMPPEKKFIEQNAFIWYYTDPPHVYRYSNAPYFYMGYSNVTDYENLPWTNGGTTTLARTFYPTLVGFPNGSSDHSPLPIWPLSYYMGITTNYPPDPRTNGAILPLAFRQGLSGRFVIQIYHDQSGPPWPVPDWPPVNIYPEYQDVIPISTDRSYPSGLPVYFGAPIKYGGTYFGD